MRAPADSGWNNRPAVARRSAASASSRASCGDTAPRRTNSASTSSHAPRAWNSALPSARPCGHPAASSQARHVSAHDRGEARDGTRILEVRTAHLRASGSPSRSSAATIAGSASSWVPSSRHLRSSAARRGKRASPSGRLGERTSSAAIGDVERSVRERDE